MQGRRRPDNTEPHELENGDYSKWVITPVGSEVSRTTWFVKTPNGIHGNLQNHKVIENQDSSISVLPPGAGEPANSILAQEHSGGPILRSWHGFIYDGVWKEC